MQDLINWISIYKIKKFLKLLITSDNVSKLCVKMIKDIAKKYLKVIISFTEDNVEYLEDIFIYLAQKFAVLNC